MDVYNIIVTSSENPNDVGKLKFTQLEIDNFLDSASPYNEAKMYQELEDDSLVDIVSIEVKNDNGFYKWHGAYYPKDIFTLMLVQAFKYNTLRYIDVE